MAYLSWSFLKMGEKSDRRTSLLFLLMAGIPIIFTAFFVFMLAAATVWYAWPVLLPMLHLLYLPCALRKEKVQSVHSRNILFGRDPLTVVFRPVVRNWVYAVYAVLPALPLLFSGWKMPLDSLGNGRNLAEFFLMWISLYAVFTVLTVFLGKARYLKPGRLLLAAGANLALMLLYSLLAGSGRTVYPACSPAFPWTGLFRGACCNGGTALPCQPGGHLRSCWKERALLPFFP